MTDSVRVRFAARGDLPRLWELLLGLAEFERWTEYVTGTQEQLGELLFGPRPAGEALVAERDGRLVGYALFFPVMSSFRTRTMLWLEDLYVEEAERGRGTGRALLVALVRHAIERGHARIDWHVLDWNDPAIGFYERLGARRSATDVFTYSLPEEGLKRLAGEHT
ncbi:MAG: GNAT family N-acetyltransferase [Candidatus Eisenbacteria bacterium]|nr:GNAT family N-acetyltransferase [Candidatus Eisenbacteria bacterium]